jgi:hypothetical protein
MPDAGRAQLRDQHRLLKLRDGAEHLADERPGRVGIAHGQVGARVGGDDGDAGPAHLGQDELAHHEVAREPVGPFDQDDADAVRLHARHEVGEAGPVIEVARAAHAFVAVLADKREAVRLRVPGDGIALPGEPVAVDLPAARHAQVGERLFLLHVGDSTGEPAPWQPSFCRITVGVVALLMRSKRMAFEAPAALVVVVVATKELARELPRP